MTKSEAIKVLEKYKRYAEGILTDEVLDSIAFDMAIEALQAEPTKAVPPSLADVYKWERDVVLAQLEEYGIGFAEKKRDDLVEAVRCKDCIHAEHREQMPNQIYCHRDKLSLHSYLHDDDDFCKYGERREE